jgi:hypothetical protein
MDPGDELRTEDDRDGWELRALFAREPAHFPEQPFLSGLARRVADERRRRVIITRFVSATAIGVAIAALLAAAPWLILGSALLSAKLDALFSAAASELDSPFGFGAGLLCFAAAAFVFHRRLFG